jgi:hypothetical protein
VSFLEGVIKHKILGWLVPYQQVELLDLLLSFKVELTYLKLQLISFKYFSVEID